jgi:dsDNA-specific endonuclease/ATPase MutS2
MKVGHEEATHANGMHGNPCDIDERRGVPAVGEMTHEDDEVVVLPIEDAIDLHAFAPREVLDAVEGYLEAAVEAGFREVRLIHGRGTGFQRDRVRELLSRHADVESFRDAPPERGGWGATIVLLRQG